MERESSEEAERKDVLLVLRQVCHRGEGGAFFVAANNLAGDVLDSREELRRDGGDVCRGRSSPRSALVIRDLRAGDAEQPRLEGQSLPPKSADGREGGDEGLGRDVLRVGGGADANEDVAVDRQVIDVEDSAQ